MYQNITGEKTPSTNDIMAFFQAKRPYYKHNSLTRLTAGVQITARYRGDEQGILKMRTVFRFHFLHGIGGKSTVGIMENGTPRMQLRDTLGERNPEPLLSHELLNC